MQGLREHTVPHRLHHFDHTAHTGGGLCVGDVRLQRSQVQGQVVRPVLAVGGQQCLSFDRVAEAGAGPVPFDGVDLAARQTRACKRLADDPFLRRAVGGGEPVGRAVGVHCRTPDHRQYPVAVALCVGEPFQ